MTFLLGSITALWFKALL